MEFYAKPGDWIEKPERVPLGQQGYSAGFAKTPTHERVDWINFQNIFVISILKHILTISRLNTWRSCSGYFRQLVDKTDPEMVAHANLHFILDAALPYLRVGFKNINRNIMNVLFSNGNVTF